MRTVCVGVTVHAQPDQLQATLRALCAHTPAAAQLLLLPDGPDAPTRALLARLGGIPQHATAEPLGAAACFNRLIAATQADVLVLIESGALVGPGWLDRLLAALEASPGHGLAGPSTNRCWNEQAAFPDTQPTPQAIADAARAAQRQFGSATSTLEPLYSLADFCYAVTRATVRAVGPADEGYGLGPCWEMDYNVRAARLGFQGVWVRGAYVHRLPPTPRRQREDHRRMAESRRRYQDSFCALRLSGRRADYEPHCRGDSCEHFAPPALFGHQGASPGPAAPPARASAITSASSPPMVSCIMPTRNRPEYVLQSVRYFQRQNYPERELIIIDDGAPGLAEQMPDDPRIRYQHHSQQRSIGAKRNHACALASGEYIAHWDDDDWYSPDRLSAQVAPLANGRADITALLTAEVFDLGTWSFWRCSPDLHRRMFIEDVHGGTLVYRRQIWERTARYPDRSLAEDAALLRQAIRYGARLQRVDGERLFIYLRHGSNSWSFRCGAPEDGGWLPAAEPAQLAPDRAFYQARAQASAAGPTPLVSCIMPTADRRGLAALAIRSFQRQRYPHRELIVVDDGDDPIDDLVRGDPQICYIRLPQRTVLGEKRNIACQAAQGELICHWDDDDWMSPERLGFQVAALLRQGAGACGMSQLLYYDPQSEAAWLYRHTAPGRRWVAGNTLLYQRSLWQQRPFAPIGIGEDTRFLWGMPPGSLLSLADLHLYVGLIHSGNTAPKRTASAGWQRRAPDQIQSLLGPALPEYVAASARPMVSVGHGGRAQ